MGIPLRLVYRSRSIQYPLIAAINASRGWEQAGIDLESIKFVSSSANSDPMLINGECDFIFGSHVSPYLHRANGHPFVYLGQTVNWVDDVLVSREPIRSLKELEGKRLSENPRVTPERHGGNHTGGNHLLYMRFAGVDTRKVDFVPMKQKDRYLDVVNGDADAAFESPPQDRMAQREGLHVLPLAPMPMVQASTMTTLWPILRDRPDLCEAVVKAVLIGIHFFKTRPDEMGRVMETDVAEELGIEDHSVLQTLQRRNSAILEPRMYPTPDAVRNAFELAVMEDHSLRERLNPSSLWDIHVLRGIEESGYIDELYGGKVPGPGRVLEAQEAEALPRI